MASEEAESTSARLTRMLSQESEYDDALEVPDSLEITVNENGETVQVQKEDIECVDNKGRYKFMSCR